MAARLYLETTIPSYLTAWLSRDLIVAGHQQITQDWWRNRRAAFEIYVSQFVMDEAGSGDTQAAKERMAILKELPLLDITPPVLELAARLLQDQIMPRRAATDAAHVAISAVHGIDYLLTWNCTHIANASITKRIRECCERHGYHCPIICTPEELLEP